ncbi:hypothetical protein D3C78_428450 [compost metagenome]
MNQPATYLPFTALQLDKIRAAEAAYRRLLGISAIGPEFPQEFPQAAAEWKRLSEEVAIDLIRNLGAQEGYWL